MSKEFVATTPTGETLKTASTQEAQALSTSDVLPVLDDATALCDELQSVLKLEETILEARKFQDLEKTLKEKRRLAAKLEASLTKLRTLSQMPSWAATAKSAAVKAAMAGLETATAGYRALAEENERKLRVAHAGVTSFLSTVQEAIQSQKPKPVVYEKSGQVSTTANGSGSFLVRDI